jgi:hypothetical protein
MTDIEKVEYYKHLADKHGVESVIVTLLRVIAELRAEQRKGKPAP